MGLSFHDKESLAEVTSDLRFGSFDEYPTSNRETGNGVRIDHEENRDSVIDIQRSYIF